jgi:hypothetical protein
VVLLWHPAAALKETKACTNSQFLGKLLTTPLNSFFAANSHFSFAFRISVFRDFLLKIQYFFDALKA